MILLILLLFCLMPIQAEEERLTEASVRELAKAYFKEKPSSQSPFSVVDNDLDRITVPSEEQYNRFLAQNQQNELSQQPENRQTYQTESRFSQPAAELRAYKKPECQTDLRTQGYTVNFDDISVVQLIQFISKIAGTNFIFNSADLQGINITIVSEDSTSVSDLSAALLQILKMHNLSVVEEGNNVLIYQNQNMSRVSTVITNENVNDACDKAIITRVFQLYNIDAKKIADIVQRLASPEAIVEPSIETRHLIVTDITANVNRIADLLTALDSMPTTVTVPEIGEYRAKNADSVALAEYAREILAPLAVGSVFNVTAEKSSRTIFIVAPPYLIQKAQQLLASLDVADITALTPAPPPSVAIENNTFYMYKLKYVNGQDVAAALHEVGTNLQSTGVANLDFVNTIYSLQWIDVNNSIVITGTQDAIDKVVSLINSLDVEPKQVFIEVLILDTTLTNSLDFGVQWIALGDEQNKLAYGTGLLSTVPPNPNLQGGARAVASGTNPITGGSPAVPNPGTNLPLPVPAQLVGALDPTATSAFGLGIIGNILRHNGRSFLTLGALISALDEEGDVSVVLNPKIMVEDTQPADFFVGQNIPYQTTSTVIQQTGSVTQNIQYEDIGVQLQVTPTIAPNNMVTLQINQTVADVVGLPGATNLTPVTTKTLATTRVHVPDGTFLVMSGHVRDDCVYIRSGIPCLGTLPLIGPTFSRTIEQRKKRNLIFFIRPKVVTNIQQGLDVTNEEGYNYNWGTDPCSLIDCCCPDAPECEMYPSPSWPLSPGRQEAGAPAGWQSNQDQFQNEDGNHHHYWQAGPNSPNSPYDYPPQPYPHPVESYPYPYPYPDPSVHWESNSYNMPPP